VSVPSSAAGACVMAVVSMSAALAVGQAAPRRPPPPPPNAAAAALGAAPAPPAAAVPAAVVPVAPKVVAAKGRPRAKEPPAPAGPTPDVKLTIDAPTARGPWTMRVTNGGDVPVRLVADARLLVLEVTPRGATKPLRCELPADMRPGDDMDRPLVLPPGRSYAERFEPRLYCFGPRPLDALSQGSIVVGRLGWQGGNRARPPFEVASIAGVEPELAPLKEIVSPPVGLPDEPSIPIEAPPPVSPDDPDRVTLTLRGPVTVDAQSMTGAATTVTLHNAGKRAVIVRFRPETLRFDVTGPGGAESCRWPLSPVAAMRDLFTTVPPGGSTELSVLLAAYCSGHAFAEPGLLLVRPGLDTRHASGADLALRTFDGEVLAASPVLVRLHQGLKEPRLQRPHLEPAPSAPPTSPAALPQAP
jgi:hypothetical protein